MLRPTAYQVARKQQLLAWLTNNEKSASSVLNMNIKNRTSNFLISKQRTLIIFNYHNFKVEELEEVQVTRKTTK